MSTIINFREIRRDGKVIDDRMTVKKMMELGWAPDKIEKVCWECDGRSVEMRGEHGLLAKVVPSRDAVAFLENTDKAGLAKTLSVINADGTLRFSFPNIRQLEGAGVQGLFRYFGSARRRSEDCVGVVVEQSIDQGLFQVDIDARHGRVVGVYPIEK